MATYSSTNEYQAGLQRSLERYQSMVKELQASKATAAEQIPTEYSQLLDIYKTGGEYGAGARARIAEAQKAGTAAGQAGLVRTGMSSGSLAAGVTARYARQAGQQLQEVEDIRYEKLGTALQAVAAAREARGMRISQAYQTTASLIGGFQEPSKSQYESGLDVAKLQAQSAEYQTAMQIAAQKSAANVAARAEEQAASQKKWETWGKSASVI